MNTYSAEAAAKSDLVEKILFRIETMPGNRLLGDRDSRMRALPVLWLQKLLDAIERASPSERASNIIEAIIDEHNKEGS